MTQPLDIGCLISIAMTEPPETDDELTKTEFNSSGLSDNKSVEDRTETTDSYIKGLRLHLITAAYEYLLVQVARLLTRTF